MRWSDPVRWGRVKRGCRVGESPLRSEAGDGGLSPTLRLIEGHPRGGDGVLPREPGAARVRGAREGLAVLDRPPLRMNSTLFVPRIFSLISLSESVSEH